MNFGETMHLEYREGKPDCVTGEVLDCDTALANRLGWAQALSPRPNLVRVQDSIGDAAPPSVLGVMGPELQGRVHDSTGEFGGSATVI